jgi:CBS domain-containing protein
MPYLIKEFIEDRPRPVRVSLDTPLKDALALMIEHDYSQLPVVDDDDKPIGLITSDNVLRALNNFEVTVRDLRVSDADLARVSNYGEEDKVIDVLDAVLDESAVLVVDGQQRLIGIITSYDTTKFFRQRAEDMMYIEDIETLLKEYIKAVFTDEDGDQDEQELEEAIKQITPSNDKLKGPFQKALSHYLQLVSNGEDKKAQRSLAMRAFEEHIYEKPVPKPFEQLTLSDYIQLFLHQSRWERYASIFTIDRSAIQHLLEDVRDMRNTLAHFRDELTAVQRDKLRYCLGWLERHYSGIEAVFLTKRGDPRVAPLKVAEPASSYTAYEAGDEMNPVEEEPSPSDSRYAPLAIYLQQHPPEQDSVALSFKEIEELIQGDLPGSARAHRSWWANDSFGQVHSRQWLDIGWRVARLNMSDEQVVFVRMEGRQGAYIDFFSRLIAELGEVAPFEPKDLSPKGYSWQEVLDLPEDGDRHAVLVFSFARGRRFRVELYIEAPRSYRDFKAVNKQLFNYMAARKGEIEAELDASLAWERLDNRIASRIAFYKDDISITDSESALTELRQDAVDKMIRFYRVVVPHFEEAVHQLLPEQHL